MKVLVALVASIPLLTGQTLGRLSGATPFAAGFQASAPGEATRGVTLPRFEEYPSTRLFTGRPAPALVESAPYGRMYRTRLRQGSSEGPNFDGAFTVVVWGCGSNCQVVAVVDAKTGNLSEQTLRTTNGVAFRRDSRLLIADPVHAGDPPLDTCAACGVPAAYEWNGSRFEPVGSGPHPHPFGDRPW